MYFWNILPFLRQSYKATPRCSDQREDSIPNRTSTIISDAQRALILETANRVALDILSSRTGVEALRHIATAARTLTNARYAALGVARRGGTGLSEFVTVGMSPEEEARIGPLPQGVGILGLLLKCSDPLRLDNLAEHPASVGFPPHHPPMGSFLGVPIRRENTVLGALYLTEKENGEGFSPADEVVVQALSAHAAVAIHHMEMLLQQRSLVRGMIMAQEEERRAVAYDLHDGLTQYVMASHAHLESFKVAQDGGKTQKAARELEQGMKLLKEAVTESRRLVNGLRLLALDDLGLAGALDLLMQEEKTRAGWESADFVHNIAGRRFEEMLETAIYRVAQEALTNARRHSATTQVRMMLLEEAPADADSSNAVALLRLEIRDWGRGFDSTQSADSGHFGLHSIIERIHLMSGTYEIRSAPDEGTRLCANFPALPAVVKLLPSETGQKKPSDGEEL